MCRILSFVVSVSSWSINRIEMCRILTADGVNGRYRAFHTSTSAVFRVLFPTRISAPAGSAISKSLSE
jgi:hypothetical protein